MLVTWLVKYLPAFKVLVAQFVKLNKLAGWLVTLQWAHTQAWNRTTSHWEATCVATAVTFCLPTATWDSSSSQSCLDSKIRTQNLKVLMPSSQCVDAFCVFVLFSIFRRSLPCSTGFVCSREVVKVKLLLSHQSLSGEFVDVCLAVYKHIQQCRISSNDFGCFAFWWVWTVRLPWTWTKQSCTLSACV